MKVDCIVGVDVGKTGGIAIKYNDHYKVHKMPELKQLDELLKYYKEVSTDLLVVIESVRLLPGDMNSGAEKNFGRAVRMQKMLDQFAQIKAILEIAEIKYKLVSATTWQSDLQLRPKGWRKLTKSERKRIYQKFANHNFPTKVNLDVSDAVCILIWALRNIKHNPDF